MTEKQYVQLDLFQQMIEVEVAPACTVKRAAALVGCSEECIYQQLSQKKRYERDAATVKWRVYPARKENGSMLLKVAFVYDPEEKVWSFVYNSRGH